MYIDIPYYHEYVRQYNDIHKRGTIVCNRNIPFVELIIIDRKRLCTLKVRV